MRRGTQDLTALQASLVAYNSCDARAAELRSLLALCNSEKVMRRHAMLDQMDRLREKYGLEEFGCCGDDDHCGDGDHEGDDDQRGNDNRREDHGRRGDNDRCGDHDVPGDATTRDEQN